MEAVGTWFISLLPACFRRRAYVRECYVCYLQCLPL